MHDMKTRLTSLIHSDKWKETPVYIFGYTEYTYDALKIIMNEQSTVSGILSNEYDCINTGSVCGVPIIQYAAVKAQKDREFSVLVSFREYKNFWRFFCKEGFKINHDLFVEFGQQRGETHIKLLCMQSLGYFITLMDRNCCWVTRKVKILKNYISTFFHVWEGERVYHRISAEISDKDKLFVYDYSGLGDVYILCGLLQGNLDKICHGKVYVSVIGKASKKVADLFPDIHAIVLSDIESKRLSEFIRVFGKEKNVKLITPFSRTDYTDVLSPTMCGYKLNMLDMYKYVYFQLDYDDTFWYPQVDSKEEYLSQYFEQNGLLPHRTIVFSPYANTEVGYPIQFWEQLADELKKKGYAVCTNCSGREREIPGTVRASFGLELAENFVTYAGYFIAVRSGFCDIVCNSSAKKIIIYPVYKLFNTNIFDFCSFQKMGIGKNYEELKWNYSNLEQLSDKVISCMEKE